MLNPSNPTEAGILGEVARLGFPPFKLTFERHEGVRAHGRGRESRRADAELTLAWEGRRERFVVECKALATPRQVESALAQLRVLTADGSARPMLIAAYLAPATLDRLARDGVSGIDLAGNGVITVPGQWFVLKTGNANPYPASAPIKNIYRGRSSLVCRALLQQRSYPSVGALVERVREAGVTQATVSKVLKTLEEELIITRTPKADAAPSIRLAQAAELLDRLVVNYRPPQATRTMRAVLADVKTGRTPADALSALAKRAGLRSAVDLPTPYVPFAGSEEITIYVELLTPIVSAGAIREDERFATVRLVETTDPTAYFDARTAAGIRYVSPIQAYLELATGEKREREIAEVLRARVLKEAGRADENDLTPGPSA